MESKEILEYKNFYLFYNNLYTRLFNLINHIIDEKKYNIRIIKEETQDFLDTYSYYIIQKKLITKDEEEKGLYSDENILKNLKEFNSFTNSLNDYPSQEYIKIRQELQRQDFSLEKLNQTQYNYLIREYYSFFNNILIILQNFIDVTSINGFLPNIKSKSALKTIGYTNYELFFTKLEELKLKMSEITTSINLTNIFKSRRCVMSILIIFSPYFTRLNLYEDFINKLDFKFITKDNVLTKIKKSYSYKDFYSLPQKLKQELSDEIINPIKSNTSLIKRYIAFEFGERDLNPKIKRKFGYDPTGV